MKREKVDSWLLACNFLVESFEAILLTIMSADCWTPSSYSSPGGNYCCHKCSFNDQKEVVRNGRVCLSPSQVQDTPKQMHGCECPWFMEETKLLAHNLFTVWVLFGDLPSLHVCIWGGHTHVCMCVWRLEVHLISLKQGLSQGPGTGWLV